MIKPSEALAQRILLGCHRPVLKSLTHPTLRVSEKAKSSDLPSQLLFKYTDTNTGGTVKKSTTEFTSSQNHSLSLAAINWGEREIRQKDKMRGMVPAFTVCPFVKGPTLGFCRVWRMTLRSSHIILYTNRCLVWANA